MSCLNGGGLRFVFDELNRNNKPCLNLDKSSDLHLLSSALQFANANCIQMDGCCTSRVFASLASLKNPSSINTQTDFSDLSSKQAAYSDLISILCPPNSVTDTCSCQ